jgi:hypothetical protein
MVVLPVTILGIAFVFTAFPSLFRRLFGLRRSSEAASATSEEERSSRAYRKA